MGAVGGGGRGMQSLMKDIAEDIKSCANSCDVWSGMRLLVRLLRAPFWESTFVKFAELFASRRKALVAGMSAYTALSVSKMSDKLHDMMELMKESLRCVLCGL